MCLLSKLAPATVFIGNPGTGKSSLINCYLKEKLFHSGVSSNGVGVTFELDKKEFQGRQWMDTPGLADIKLRKAAAAAIDDTLRTGGEFQVMFVLKLDGGRIRADDLTTIYLVLEAAGEQITEDSYAIFFNQVPSRVLKRINRDEFNTNLCDSLRSKGCPTTKYVHFNQYVEDMDGEDDMLCDLDDATYSFIANCPSIVIDNKLVKDVNADAFDEIKAQNESLLNELHASKAAAASAQHEKELADARAMEALEAEKKAAEAAESAQREKEVADARAQEAQEAERKAEEAAETAQHAKELADARALEAEQKAKNAKETAKAEYKREMEKKAAAERARMGPQKWDTWTEGKPFTVWDAHTGRNLYMSRCDRYAYNEDVDSCSNTETRRRVMKATVVTADGLGAYIHLGDDCWKDQLYRSGMNGQCSYENYGVYTNSEDSRRIWYLHRLHNGNFEISLADRQLTLYQNSSSRHEMHCETSGTCSNNDDRRRQWRISTTRWE